MPRSLARRGPHPAGCDRGDREERRADRSLTPYPFHSIPFRSIPP